MEARKLHSLPSKGLFGSATFWDGTHSMLHWQRCSADWAMFLTASWHYTSSPLLSRKIVQSCEQFSGFVDTKEEKKMAIVVEAKSGTVFCESNELIGDYKLCLFVLRWQVCKCSKVGENPHGSWCQPCKSVYTGSPSSNFFCIYQSSSSRNAHFGTQFFYHHRMTSCAVTVRESTENRTECNSTQEW